MMKTAVQSVSPRIYTPFYSASVSRCTYTLTACEFALKSFSLSLTRGSVSNCTRERERHYRTQPSPLDVSCCCCCCAGRQKSPRASLPVHMYILYIHMHVCVYTIHTQERRTAAAAAASGGGQRVDSLSSIRESWCAVCYIRCAAAAAMTKRNRETSNASDSKVRHLSILYVYMYIYSIETSARHDDGTMQPCSREMNES